MTNRSPHRAEFDGAGRNRDLDADLPEGWSAVDRAGALFRRFEFQAYSETRNFLNRLAELSERTGRYPDLSFGRRHVNVTIHPEAESGTPDTGSAFAAEASTLYEDTAE